MKEFQPTVIGFGGCGQDFDNHQRIQQHIAIFILKLLIAASHNHIGIAEFVGFVGASPDFHIAGVHPTRFFQQLRPQ